MGKKPDDKKKKKPDKKKGKGMDIPLIPMQSDAQEMEEEMRELFQEDQVTHKHGKTEPERD